MGPRRFNLVCPLVEHEGLRHLQDARFGIKVEGLQAEYRRLQYKLLAGDSAAAEINYEFYRPILTVTRTLVERNIKSRYELVLDEYDLSQPKARLDSFRRCTTMCEKQLAD